MKQKIRNSNKKLNYRNKDITNDGFVQVTELLGADEE